MFEYLKNTPFFFLDPMHCLSSVEEQQKCIVQRDQQKPNVASTHKICSKQEAMPAAAGLPPSPQKHSSTYCKTEKNIEKKSVTSFRKHTMPVPCYLIMGES